MKENLLLGEEVWAAVGQPFIHQNIDFDIYPVSVP